MSGASPCPQFWADLKTIYIYLFFPWYREGLIIISRVIGAGTKKISFAHWFFQGGQKCPSDICPSDRCPSDRYPSNRCPSDRCPSDRCPSNRCPFDRCPSDRCLSDSCLSDRCLSDRGLSDRCQSNMKTVRLLEPEGRERSRRRRL